MEIVDAQVHLVPPSGAVMTQVGPLRPIDGTAGWSMTEQIAAMEALGIAGAIVDGAFPAELALGKQVAGHTCATYAAAHFPGVFGATFSLPDNTSADVADRVAQARSQGYLALRCYARTRREAASYEAGELDGFLSAAELAGMPVHIIMMRHLDIGESIARRYPSLRLIVDHMGMPQPPWRLDNPPLKDLGRLLALSRYENLAVKVIGGPSYSAEPYPFTDIWAPLHRIIDAFGPGRLMWGSDVGRFFGSYTYSDLLTYILHSGELGNEEKEQILGGTVRKILSFPRGEVDARPVGWRIDRNDPPSWYEN